MLQNHQWTLRVGSKNVKGTRVLTAPRYHPQVMIHCRGGSGNFTGENPGSHLHRVIKVNVTSDGPKQHVPPDKMPWEGHITPGIFLLRMRHWNEGPSTKEPASASAKTSKSGKGKQRLTMCSRSKGTRDTVTRAGCDAGLPSEPPAGPQSVGPVSVSRL